MLKSSPLAYRIAPGVMALAMVLTGPTWSQDEIVLENGNRRSGEVIGIKDGNVQFKSGPVTTTIKLDQIKSVTKAAPPAYAATLDAWSKGEAQAALGQLRPLVENFEGLPTPWAQRATALLGEIQLSQGQIDAAEETLQSFQESYPDATDLAAASLARVAIEKGDLQKARENIAPILEESSKSLYVEPATAATYAQAHYVMGRILEGEGNLEEALQNYITAYAVYHDDPAVARLAKERAEKLEADKSAVVP